MPQQQQRYKVLEKIASGGMAEVFRAESAGLEGFKKTVAIKRVLPHLSEKKQFIGMFLDEARLSAHLSHSNCVQVFDVGVGDNTYFIVMEYVDGTDLKAIIESRKKLGQAVPIEEACLICVRLCEGLAYAHGLTDGRGRSLHIVHRDMSPPNVLVTKHGEVKIVDFGLAKANVQLEKSEPGIIKGKFSYLSPEAALGKEVDARTDIFAVGIILWEMLANRRLFMGESDLETVRQVQSAAVPPIGQFNREVPQELEAVLRRTLAQDPSARYRSAYELGRDLNNILFRFGRAVSSFDIAQLVDPVVRERAAKQRAKTLEKGSVIGSLIEEVLFEFTSLEEDESESGPGADIGSSPLNIDSFEHLQDWAADLGDLGLDTGARDRVTPPPVQFEVGNLAALEEDSLSPGRRSAVAQGAAPVQDDSKPGADLSDLDDLDLPTGKSSSKLRWVVVLLVLILGALAAAYYSGAFSSAGRLRSGSDQIASTQL
jgi:serine/threonine protein kinase